MLLLNNECVDGGNKQNKVVYFSKVIIHGRITNFAIKEFRGGKKSIKLSVSTFNGCVRDDVPADYVDHEIDVYVERKYALKTSKRWLVIGKSVVLDGRIALLFIRNNEKLVKRVQYISIENVLFSGDNGLAKADEGYSR